MNLLPWKKRTPLDGTLARLRDEMERTFDRFFTEPLGLASFELSGTRAQTWIPPLDVSETDSEVTIRAEVPGIAIKDLAISVAGTTLTIAGEKEERKEKKEENFHQSECHFGSFRRVLDLPDRVDAGRVTAEYDNGVVTVHVAKKPGVQARQVEIKPAGETRPAPDAKPTPRKIPVGV
ncbi:MAG: Hsp20/alpha crystallin family protein [Planctomycetota bacterium]